MKTPSEPRSRRTATAEAELVGPDSARQLLETSAELLSEARVVAMLVARRAGETLPHTPAVELDELDITFTHTDDGLHIAARVGGFSRGSLASRALLCATTCAAAIVDAVPDHAADVAVRDARVTGTRGGASGLSYDFDPPVQAAILVVSDAVAGGHKDDRAGRIVRDAVDSLEAHGVELANYEVLGDQPEEVAERVEKWAASDIDLVLTVGGTGLVPTDRTVEAIEPLLDRSIPGLMEALRDYGLEQTPLAYISRGVAGMIADTLVVTLPGSTGGAREAAEALFPAALHVFKVLRKAREHLSGDHA